MWFEPSVVIAIVVGVIAVYAIRFKRSVSIELDGRGVRLSTGGESKQVPEPDRPKLDG